MAPFFLQRQLKKLKQKTYYTKIHGFNKQPIVTIYNSKLPQFTKRLHKTKRKDIIFMKLKRYSLSFYLPVVSLSRRTKLKIKNFILKALAFIAILNLTLFAILFTNLTTDGLILAAIIDIPSAVYLILLSWANNAFEI